MRLELLERNTGTKVKKLQALTLSICLENCRIVATCLLCYSKTMELNSCVGNEQWDRTGNVVIYA